MSFHLVDNKLSNIYVGDNKINKIFIGNNLIYSSMDSNIHEYFYFEAIEKYGYANVGLELYHDVDISESLFTGYTRPVFEYSYDKNTWYSYTLGSIIRIHTNENKRVYFRGNNTATWRGTYVNGGTTYTIALRSIIPNTKIRCGGNIMSLRYKNFEGQIALPCTYTFSNFFNGCYNLVTAPALPATTLADYCYTQMFANCTSLTTMPQLPATTLADYCYSQMFSGCTSLINISKLASTQLKSHCYYHMFNNCTSLKSAPKLLATTLAAYCYYSMFANCISLVEAPTLPAITLASDCYAYMFSNCTSLTIPPKLPATTLASFCYSSMFAGCTSLTKIPELLVTTLPQSCYDRMFSNSSITASATQSSLNTYSYRIPKTGTGTTQSYYQPLYSMFTDYTPTINTTFYVSVPTLT